MNKEKLDFFKQLLSVPSKTYDEYLMIDFITSYLHSKNYDYDVDEMGNIYVTKGDADLYPCFVAHTDTVHAMSNIRVEEFDVEVDGEMKKALRGKGIFDDSPVGIGGDDKCGIFIALQILEQVDNVKCAFFVSEELGCIGSHEADPLFFDNVQYVVEFDAPSNYMVTEYCSGLRVFDRDSSFFKQVEPIMRFHFNKDAELMSHPYTDIYALKKKFPHIQMINFSCGYYEYHTEFEYIILDDVERSLNFGLQIHEKVQ